MQQALRHKWQRRAARWIPSGLLQHWAGPVALFFHGVELRLEDESLQRNHMPLDDFYRIAKELKTQCEVLPLAWLAHALAHPKKHRRTVFLMADDGYANTYTLAQDVLRRTEIALDTLRQHASHRYTRSEIRSSWRACLPVLRPLESIGCRVWAAPSSSAATGNAGPRRTGL